MSLYPIPRYSSFPTTRTSHGAGAVHTYVCLCEWRESHPQQKDWLAYWLALMADLDLYIPLPNCNSNKRHVPWIRAPCCGLFAHISSKSQQTTRNPVPSSLAHTSTIVDYAVRFPFVNNKVTAQSWTTPKATSYTCLALRSLPVELLATRVICSLLHFECTRVYPD